METCDVLIVGGGPAGSSCAWKLRGSGVDTLVLDKNVFPRDKVCAGWITPAVIEELQIDTQEYSCGRVLQPIHGFKTSLMGGREAVTDYGKPISYGIRRCEFDDYLLKRSGARLMEGVPLAKLERAENGWVVNGGIQARIVVGAGGHFCPVARFLGATARAEIVIAAQEAEFELTRQQDWLCRIRPEMPELYFCPDMKGYGWCVKKGNFLNVGLGRLDPQRLPGHVADMLEFLKTTGKVGFELPVPMKGHSYILSGHSQRNVSREGILLVGDAVGLAYPQSGEGIRPAVESGLLAARAILDSRERGGQSANEIYRELIRKRFEADSGEWAATVAKLVPAQMARPLARLLLANGWFSQHIVLDRWFLHRNEPALVS